ncbi:hypothetical protein B0T12DRAFT_403500 [Alternaria alternata]|nr:hypothetical protein B0T12DRAFT_403500 [Alternaria alternata]
MKSLLTCLAFLARTIILSIQFTSVSACARPGDRCKANDWYICECNSGWLLACKHRGGGHRADMHLSESSSADTRTWVLAKNCPVPSDRGLQCVEGNCNEGRKKYEVALNG